MEKCPVESCHFSFLNKYSLTNHIRRNVDPEHNRYYKERIEKRICPECKKKIDNRRTLYEGVCYTCFYKKKPPQKKIKKERLKRYCFHCNKELIGLFSKMNTRILCPDCKKISKNNKYEYNKKFDRIRYDKAIEVRRVQRDKKKKEKINTLFNLLKDDLLFSEMPVYKICAKYKISLLSIRKILPLLNLNYKKRNHDVRSRATLKRIEDIKNYFKNRPDPRTVQRHPSSLEKKVGEQIKKNFPDAEIRYNVWKSIKDEINNCYVHLESDIIINFGELRIIVLCDGEAFHGEDCYFNGDTRKIDEWKSRILHKKNPFIFRYSETEIKKNEAIDHLIKILRDIKDKKIIRYYKNWMLNIEEKEVP